MKKTQGHGGNTPNLPIIRAVDNPLPITLAMKNGTIQPGTRSYKMGKIKIMVSPPVSGVMGWHMSLSHPDRYPTWDEIAKARYELIPDAAEMVMHLPPRADYVNVHNFCFHLHQLEGTFP